MMSGREELKVPEEMVDLMDEYYTCIKCRNECIRSVFKSKRAIYYGKMAEKARRKFWDMAIDLYPQVKDGTWVYSFDRGAIMKAKEGELD